MKHNFKFDKKTGTMIAAGSSDTPKEEIGKVEAEAQTQKPAFNEGKKMEVKSDMPNVAQNHMLRMQRVDRPTAVQLLDGNGVPEAYLDSVSTGVMMFREMQDYDIYQIVDERTNKPLAYIGGYALQINFDMSELKSMERIEQCLNGLTKLFRKFIMDQAVNR